MGISAPKPATSAGHIGHFAANAIPSGWLKANGAAISRSVYGALFSVIGTTYGAGDGSTTFNLPDLRGEFLRGFDDGRGVDSGRVFGSAQAHQNSTHSHDYTTGTESADHGHGIGVAGVTGGGCAGGGNWVPTGGAKTVSDGRNAAHTHSGTTAGNGGTEARPRNISMIACIKY